MSTPTPPTTMWRPATERETARHLAGYSTLEEVEFGPTVRETEHGLEVLVRAPAT